MTLSNNYKPFMAYLTPVEYSRLKKFSKTSKIPMAQLVREGVSIRLSPGDKYINGFNDGLECAAKATKALTASEMRFPSGKTFGEMVEDELLHHRMKETADESLAGSA